MLKKIAIVVPSCDKYSDLWNPLFQNLKHKWPNIPFKIYLITNHKNFDFKGVHVIKVGDDLTWCANFKTALKQVEEENIFLLIDDLFFTQKIDEQIILPLFKDFVAKNKNYLRFNPTPGPTGALEFNNTGEIKKGDYYRSSTVMCLWKKEVLINILCERESAWEFEIVGSGRTDQYDGWYASAKWTMPYHNLVIKGKYDPLAYWTLKNNGLQLDTTRQKMNVKEYIRFVTIRLRAALFRLVPRLLRRTIRDKFKAS